MLHLKYFLTGLFSIVVPVIIMYLVFTILDIFPEISYYIFATIGGISFVLLCYHLGKDIIDPDTSNYRGN